MNDQEASQVQSEETEDVCPECGTPGVVYEMDDAQGMMIVHCEGCGGWEDSYADLFGVMAVPWGFAL